MRIARFVCSFLLAVGILTIPAQSRAQVAVGVSIRVDPPVLPVYAQPICPGSGYIWIPGYWAYGPDGYFWVPGTWAEPPEVGLLWTPGYWGWEADSYVWHTGYWGPEVGFYGGINYGFGYTGVGFFGGHWRGSTYFYNRAVTNINVSVVQNTYSTTVINNSTTINRVSFNGGQGGVNARPTSREIAAEHQRHVTMTAEQNRHQQAASTNRTLLASVNHGRPDVAASVRPGQFDAHGVAEAAKPAASNRSASPPSNATPVNPALEQKHQQQLDQLNQQQGQERQRVEQKHQQEQQKLQQRAADDRKQQDAQHKQQQQIQQLEQKHAQQQQKLQQKQQQERQKQQKPVKPPSPSRPPHDDKPAA